MSRLFWKLFLALWLSIMAFSIVNAWFHSYIIRQNYLEPAQNSAQSGLQEVEDRLGSILLRRGPDAVASAIRRLPGPLEARIYLVGPDGQEVLGRNRVIRAMARRETKQRSTSLLDASGDEYTLLMVAQPPPLPLFQAGGRGVVHRMMLSAVISALVSLLLARYLARPLESLSVASRSLATGDLETRVGAPLTDRKDEFGGLARDFDRMAEHLLDLQKANETLLRDVSHELRSPLARLRVALEIARGRDGGQVSNELDRIELESERLETLIDQVLQLLRETNGPGDLKLERFDLAEMFEDLSELVAYEMPSAMNLRVECPRPLELTADRELIWRAVENLLRNALRYSPSEGEVLLSAEHNAQGGIDLSVIDSGPGIPAAMLPRVFDPFFRAQSARERESGGHGLGLAIAAAAVNRHAGHIKALNRPEGGLEVQVSLPSNLH